MFKTEIVEVGDSLGFALPVELLEAWNVGVGDTIYAVEAENGIRLLPQLSENVDVDQSCNGLLIVGKASK